MVNRRCLDGVCNFTHVHYRGPRAVRWTRHLHIIKTTHLFFFTPSLFDELTSSCLLFSLSPWAFVTAAHAPLLPFVLVAVAADFHGSLGTAVAAKFMLSKPAPKRDAVLLTG